MAAEHEISNEESVSRAQVLEKIKRMVAEQSDIPADRIQETDRLEDDLGLDSLDFEELVMKAEEAFGVDVSDEIDWKTVTVASVTDAVVAGLHRTGL
jgi:acyl carrier protein